nr:metal-dependent hydrolase [Halorubellus sp. JP-L1]
MFAFALVALVASRGAGVDDRRALALGAIAGAFAAVPDADMAYALSGVLDLLLGDATAGGDGAFAVTGAFWAASTAVHRSMTHSIVVAPVAALGFALLAVRGRRARPAAVVGVGVLAALAVAAATLHGGLGLFVFVAFAVAGAVVATVVRTLTEASATTTFALAVAGLVTHPFGDVFTGDPPALLWPLDAVVLDARVVLAADPTLHLLGAFAVELAVVAVALLVYADLTGRALDVRPRSVAGLAYGGAVLVLPPPTLEVSYQFVFTILALGVVTATQPLGRRLLGRSVLQFRQPRLPGAPAWPGATAVGRRAATAVDEDAALAAATTGVATVALALLAYATGYLVLA